MWKLIFVLEKRRIDIDEGGRVRKEVEVWMGGSKDGELGEEMVGGGWMRELRIK